MAFWSQFFIGIQQIPYFILLIVGGYMALFFGGLTAWWYLVLRHPIQLHIRLMRSAGNPWVKVGARIVAKKDGTAFLKVLGRKKMYPAPSLEFIHANKTLALFRRTRAFYYEDTNGDLHPVKSVQFNHEFVPESMDMRFFHVHALTMNDKLFTEKQNYLKQNLPIIISAGLLAVMMIALIVITKMNIDAQNAMAGMLAGAANNLASAISGLGL